jgi:hypothetical protein
MEVKFKSLRGGWCSNEVLGTFGVGIGNILEDGEISFTTLFNLRLGWGACKFLA